MKYYQVHSFVSPEHLGNPAGVCLVYDMWAREKMMQRIAYNLGLSETAFVLETEVGLFIRWFTPTCEVALCGHATLAAAHVLKEKHQGKMVFQSSKYTLPVQEKHGLLVMEFPKQKIKQITHKLSFDVFNITPKEYWEGDDEYLFVFEHAEDVKNLVCDYDKAKKMNHSGIIVTAPGYGKYDFVSRYFGPKIGINEDPVTGSAHTYMVPYWQNRLKKDTFVAAQLSRRGGELHLNALKDRVSIGGKAETFLKGAIEEDWIHTRGRN